MQDRKTYAKGSTLESTTGYIVKVGMPVVDDTVKATSNGATFTQNAHLTDGQYLVTLEVNGEAVAYKESITADSGITVGDYSVAENAGKIVLSGASANDIVRLLIEPLEVETTAAFRAAVKKDAPKTPNELPAVASTDKGKFLHTNESTGALEWAEGGSGGSVEIVRFKKTKAADSDTSGTCDHTLEQMISAATSGKTIMCYIADANAYVTPTGILLITEDSQDAFIAFVYGDDTKIYKITAYMTSENVVTITREEVQ